MPRFVGGALSSTQSGAPSAPHQYRSFSIAAPAARFSWVPLPLHAVAFAIVAGNLTLTVAVMRWLSAHAGG